jgi:hypothetical protein
MKVRSIAAVVSATLVASALAVLGSAHPADAAPVAGTFQSLAQVRLLDTRTGVGAPEGAVAAGGTVHLQVTGRVVSRPRGSRQWC